MPNLRILFSLTLILAILGGVQAVSGYQSSLPGCPDRCGEMIVPYPFGTKDGCYLEEYFHLTCNDTSYNPPMAFLGNISVTEIMLLSGELRSLIHITRQCLDSNAESYNSSLRLEKFTVSYSKNKFTVVGCDSVAYFKGGGFETGCIATCGTLEDAVNGSCAGIGCCQTSIPTRAKAIEIDLESLNNNHTSHCSYAFVVEENAYNFSSADFTSLTKVESFPVVFDWTIGNLTCAEGKQNLTSYACKENSDCQDPANGPGYICNCTKGYQGNPYLQNGCQDIDECTMYQPCSVTCINLPGGYEYTCPKGYTGNGRKDGTGCTPIPISSVPKSDRNVLIIALGVSISISTLLLASAWIYWRVQKRKLIQLRKKYFQENGGFALQTILSQYEREIDTFKIFSAKELNKATNNYEESRVLGKGGQGTVYKGKLADNNIVAIKKSNVIDKSQVQQFINEVAMLSQINHRNVVKLLGCCLETEVPMLVYEFITNGTLFDRIQKDHTPRMPWHTRLRIAAEIAGALSYLHYSALIPIIHRDIKTTNILLDATYTAKVSDLGSSRFAPVDKTSLITLVQGTLGYLDPEYYLTSQLTEKSDVFGFGVVLVELLTGEKALNFDRKEEDRSLAMYFALAMKENRLFGIIDESIKRQVTTRQLTEVAMIAARCLNMRGEDRPTMKEVAAELEVLLNKETHHPWVQVDVNVEQENEVLLDRSMGTDSIPLPASSLQIGR